MPPDAPDPLDLSRLKHFPFAERRSLVSADDLREPPPVPPDFAGAASMLSEVKTDGDADDADAADHADAASRIDRLAERIVRAVRSGRPVVLGMGAHPVKLGLGPCIVDLMERGVLTCVAMNGAAAFHDMELAIFGATSEDVAAELPAGRFGFADEPAALFNRAALMAEGAGVGLGETLAELVASRAPADRTRFSILAAAGESNRDGQDRQDIAVRHPVNPVHPCLLPQGVALTVHVAIGTDVVNLHPSADGAALGASSFFDFRRFAAVIAELRGGVYVNLGSAVMMPEVFLKAASAAVNLGADLAGVTTANLDMLDHYRPRVNVIERIAQGFGGEGIDVRGRHEETVPALRACVVAGLEGGG